MEPARKKRKRNSRHFSDGDPGMRKALDVGLGAVKALLAGETPPDPTALEDASPKDNADDGAAEDWTVVDKKAKKKKVPQPSSKNYPTIAFSKPSALKSQLKLSHLKDLILYILADSKSPHWVALNNLRQFRKVVVVMVPGLEKDMFTGPMLSKDVLEEDEALAEKVAEKLSDDYKTSEDHYMPLKLTKEKLPEPLQPMADMFPLLWPVRTPGEDRDRNMASPVKCMLNVFQTDSPKHPNWKPKEPLKKNWNAEPVRITKLLADRDTLREAEYVMHPAFASHDDERLLEAKCRIERHEVESDGWVDSDVLSLEAASAPDEDQDSVTEGRDVYAIDCEMCETTIGELELTRISIAAWDGTVILDELVKPANPIKDYLTKYSGITEEMLAQVTTSLADIQQRLKELLHAKAIIIGHSLNSDLNALKFTHPFIVDTSLIYPHQAGLPLRYSLKSLTQRYLDREIQKSHGAAGHDSIEDAVACLDLVKLKCEMGLKWGSRDGNMESIFTKIAKFDRPSHQISSTAKVPRSGSVVDWGAPERLYGDVAKLCIGCENDEEVVKGVGKAVVETPSGEIEYGGDSDFTWARLRGLETLRGWRDAKSSEDEVKAETLSRAVAQTIKHIADIHENLPPCTAFIVYTGTNDPRNMDRLRGVRRQFTREFRTKKWDELSVKWTDNEEQALKQAALAARQGLAFITVK